ncbi:MAG: EAL and GGDEF domain-containing protein [Deltaproteobacteria bacterium]|nr:EAL and GGDEF domain-containing protein [Deltaproteobacteria bacterium]
MMQGTMTRQIEPPPEIFLPSGIIPGNNAGAFVAAVRVVPHFHPIIDLFSASVTGFEVLSRGDPPYAMPRQMFAEAKRLGATWELEKACRVAALEKIASLPEPFRSSLFFINVSPDIFSDPRFLEKFTQARLQEYGIDQKQIVIEITEEKTFEDFQRFGTLVSHYANQGFKIAMDDFGSGYSGLITLIASTPHYLKLDMAIVRDVHKHDYQQKLVKALVTFASSVNARVIAEGVECGEELDVLVRHGVRYAQGFFFGRPEKNPYLLSEEMRTRLGELMEKYDRATIDVDEKVAGLVIRPMTIAARTMCCKELDRVFKKQTHLDHVIILAGEGIAGMITRQHFYAETGGAFGYQLLQKKPIEVVCKSNPLVVQDRMTVTMMAKLAMDRLSEDLYDPVLVVDRAGTFMGTVTMKQVMTKSLELEIRSAMGVNPLTGLPGNNAIHRWIHDALSWQEYSMVYIDLDQFKGYNDTYGFLMGDEMLCLTARVLTDWLMDLPEGARLGHIGGDDFVVVARGLVPEATLGSLCRRFDAEKLSLFKNDDIKRGHIIGAADRQGQPIRLPLVTMSLSVVDSRKIWTDPHPALFSEVAASLKKKVKGLTAETGKSEFLFEQRLHV